MNEIIKALHKRKSVRVFTEKEISAEEKEAILEAAIQAPSAGCQLLYTILDITDQQKKALYRESKAGAGVLRGLRKVAFFLQRSRPDAQKAGCGRSAAGSGGRRDCGPERSDGGGEPWHRFLLYRRCDGAGGRDESPSGPSSLCISGLYAGIRLSDGTSEGTDKAVPVCGFRYGLRKCVSGQK